MKYRYLFSKQLNLAIFLLSFFVFNRAILALDFRSDQYGIESGKLLPYTESNNQNFVPDETTNRVESNKSRLRFKLTEGVPPAIDKKSGNVITLASAEHNQPENITVQTFGLNGEAVSIEKKTVQDNLLYIQIKEKDRIRQRALVILVTAGY